MLPVAVAHHQDRASVLLELARTGELVRCAAPVPLQKHHVAQAGKRHRVEHSRAARRPDWQAEIGILKLVSYRPDQKLDITRNEAAVVPATFGLVPGVGDVDDDVARLPGYQVAGDIDGCGDDGLRRGKGFVLVLLEKDEAHDKALAIGGINEPVQPGRPVGFQRAVGIVGTDEGARVFP